MGLSASKPSWAATSATADDSTRLPRPAGASGLVITASTVCREAASARSAVTATGGVPAKTRRTTGPVPSGDPLRRMRRGPHLGDQFAVPFGFPDGLHRELTLLLVKPVDEQDAVEVVGLVLDAAREQFGALDSHGVAVHVEPGGDDPGGARRGELKAGQRQAALLVLLVVSVEGQHRIDQMAGLVAGVIGEHSQA